ncbi:hypothetical protein E6O75_ATG00894 [Venturia nashicola]|uniref:Uncharacterized protein n=1 Tax=Venturia nashicola TaxID=86259 RepID=A0A4Z1PKL5_9PEZI|nr:hypothetical protein E6O75_ATG00894 [Venturia nashicola]
MKPICPYTPYQGEVKRRQLVNTALPLHLYRLRKEKVQKLSFADFLVVRHVRTDRDQLPAVSLTLIARPQLTYVPAIKSLYEDIWECRDIVRALARHHLRLSRSSFYSANGSETASFACLQRSNQAAHVTLCTDSIPIFLTLISRSEFPVNPSCPHKYAENKYPGAVDETLGCEVRICLNAEYML